MTGLVQIQVRGPARQLLVEGAFETIQPHPSEDRNALELYGRDDQGRTFALSIPRDLLRARGL